MGELQPGVERTRRRDLRKAGEIEPHFQLASDAKPAPPLLLFLVSLVSFD
jgi:hypothetical protein